MHRLLAMMALTLVPAVAQADVVINELVSDLVGIDTGLEWVELYNNGDLEVDLSGWAIERARTTWGSRFTFPASTAIAPGAWLVVGEELVTFADFNLTSGATLDLGNAGSNADGVRLVDDTAAVVDTVIYGTPNSDALADDGGAPATALAPVAIDGKSIGRTLDGLDTNDCASDFAVFDVPTPGATNGGGTGSCDTGAALVINEFMADPDGTDTGLEWVEIYNGTGAAVDASGWRIESGTTAFSGQGTLPAATILAAGEYLVVGQSAAVLDADLVVTGFTLGNAASNADGVRLADCQGTVVDTVIYGTLNEDGWVDDFGAEATSLAPKPTGGTTLARIPDGTDTDLSGDDFEIAGFVTPGLSNDTLPACAAPSDVAVVINELLPNPPESDGTNEWVELYNAGTAAVDLGGWRLRSASSTWSTKLDFPDLTLGAGELLLVGGITVAGADVTWEGESAIPNGTNGDGVRLEDCTGRVLDTVVYGGNNDDLIVDDSGEVALTWAPVPGEGSSLARLQDGWDTDDCQADFVVDGAPTPGASNPIREPIVCTPSTGGVVINEVLSDPPSTDTGFEWIELFNGSGAEVSVEGWYLSLATQAEDFGAADVVIPSGAVIAAGGFLVIGADQVPEADVVLPLSIGNGTEGDGVYLFDCDGTHLDSLVYGDENLDGVIDDTGLYAEDLVPQVASGRSMARIVDGEDTDASTDWFADRTPTPGASNVEAGGGDDPGGCCSKAPDSGAPGEGCGGPPSGLAGLGGFELLLLGTIVWRRRRTAR